MKAFSATALVLCLFGAAFGQEDKLNINADHAFTDMQAVDNGIIPVEVTVANAGRDAVGSVTMTAGSYRMTYPVELPNGSKKRFFAYLPSSMQYAFNPRAEFVLDTNQGSLKQYFEIQPGMGNSMAYYLYVGDQIGLMTFMRQMPGTDPNPNLQGSMTGCRDVYSKPGRLPTRAVGFRSIGSVILGEGAERLTDNEVEALKLYAISGGTIVIPGGVSQPILSDPRWLPILPVRSAHPLTVPVFNWLRQFDHGKPLSGSISILSALPKENASCVKENGIAVVSACPVGLGRIIFLSFSPFEGALETWDGRQEMFRSLNGVRATSAFDELSFNRQDHMFPPGYAPYGAYPDSSSDPFRVTLPPVSIVVLILLVYTVLVVPFNLILLRKLNRSQWAWWTTPVISLGFAAIFFQFASKLYSASLSTARSGVIVVDDRADEGLFIGDMKMFFPRGGSYDLGFNGVETVLPLDVENYSFGNPTRESVMDSMNAVDFGEIKADSMRVKNLSFHEYSMVQRLPSAKWLSSDLVDTISNEYGKRTHSITGTIRNNSPYSITGNLVVNRTQVMPVNLSAGGSVSVYQKVVESAAAGQPMLPMGSPGVYSMGDPSNPMASPLTNPSQPLSLEGMPDTLSFAKVTRVMIRGTISGIKPGPAIGNESSGAKPVSLIALLGTTVIKEAK